MKVLFGLLVLSVTAILVIGLAVWWRLHRHLRRPSTALKNAPETVQTEHESTE
jgi:hypothetical protein